jgi:hypothetical protein
MLLSTLHAPSEVHLSQLAAVALRKELVVKVSISPGKVKSSVNFHDSLTSKILQMMNEIVSFSSMYKDYQFIMLFELSFPEITTNMLFHCNVIEDRVF